MSSWRALILRIGDKCTEYGGSDDFKEHIEVCYTALLREIDHARDEILSLIIQCAEQLPHKIPFYGTLVGLLNLESEDFAKEVVEATQFSLQDALDAEDCDRIRILMRFSTALMCSKVLQPASLVVLYETFLSSAATTVDEETGNPSWQPRADFYVMCILSCLPWGGAELIEQVPDEIERVMVGIEAYLSIRKHVYDSGFSVFEFDDEKEKSPDQKDFLEDLWDRLKVMSNNGWKVDSVPRPHLSFEPQLVSGKAYDFGTITCPEQPEPPSTLSGITCGKQKHEAELKYPRRLRRLNIFPVNKLEDIQPIDRFVVEEYLLDVLLFFNGCRKECAAYMVGLPVPFRYEYLMAETIFSQLLLLPQPRFKPSYYTLVIIDLCKALPGAFPAVVAAAVRALFDRSPELDMECRIRLILWFSHHLSNFQFFWPWEEWAYVLELPKWAPQRVFVQEVLEREVRLSYWDKIKQSIENAVELENLLPPKIGYNFKYGVIVGEGQERYEEHVLSADLGRMVKGRVVAREVISWIDEKIIPVHGPKIALEVTIQTLLDIGSKSFTHLITVLERYGQVISKLCPDHDKQVMLLEEVSSYWQNSSQMTAITIDRMMGYRLISNLAIVTWVFSPANIEQFHTSDRPWEVLRNTIDKTYNRISDLRKEILSLKKNVSMAEESVLKAQEEVDAAETKLSLMEGEPVLGDNPNRLRRLKSRVDKMKEDEVSTRDSLQAKEALLARAVGENEALFLALFKSFSEVLKARLPRDGTMRSIRYGEVDTMAVDSSEEPSAMEVDNGRPKKSNRSNGGRSSDGYSLGETEQWCLSTLGYVKAFSRQYATEIWPHIEKLDAEVFTADVHPLFRRVVYTGLRRQD
ncbi:Nucleic acid dioxygenase ALKBH1 [Ranunculus cassubicifolius]